MACICANDEWVAVSSGNNFRIFSADGDKEITLKLPPAPPPVKPKPSPDATTASEEKNVILGTQFSYCGKWCASYTSSKQLLLWETKSWTLLSERCLSKAASSLKFTPDSRALVIVDKAGDAILFPVHDPHGKGEVILGHLSMLLDVAISQDGKYIVTCDRDEKIRVSHFPNAYNIVSYCLGHKEFVSSLSLLPHKPSVLVSCSGDGNIRLWEFLTGVALATYNCSSDVIKELRLDSTSPLPENGEDGAVIVRKVFCVKVNPDSSIVCVLFHGYLGCLVYKINGLSFELAQVLLSQEVVLDLCLKNSGELMALLAAEKDGVVSYMFDQTQNYFVSCVTSSQCVNHINNAMNSLSFKPVLSSNMPQLLKRKYDNVKDYYEQKKARVDGL